MSYYDEQVTYEEMRECDTNEINLKNLQGKLLKRYPDLKDDILKSAYNTIASTIKTILDDRTNNDYDFDSQLWQFTFSSRAFKDRLNPDEVDNILRDENFDSAVLRVAKTMNSALEEKVKKEEELNKINDEKNEFINNVSTYINKLEQIDLKCSLVGKLTDIGRTLIQNYLEELRNGNVENYKSILAFIQDKEQDFNLNKSTSKFSESDNGQLGFNFGCPNFYEDEESKDQQL